MIPLGFLRPNPEELILLLLIILRLFGSKKIPDLARALGRSIGEFKKGRAEGEQSAREAANPPDATAPKPPAEGTKPALR